MTEMATYILFMVHTDDTNSGMVEWQKNGGNGGNGEYGRNGGWNGRQNGQMVGMVEWRDGRNG